MSEVLSLITLFTVMCILFLEQELGFLPLTMNLYQGNLNLQQLDMEFKHFLRLM